MSWCTSLWSWFGWSCWYTFCHRVYFLYICLPCISYRMPDRVTHTHTCTHAHMHIHTYTTHMHTHTHTHTHHSHTCTCTHTHMYTGPQHRDPSEVLAVEGEGWEEGVCALWTNVLRPLGLTPVAITRLPYLCEGDLHEEFYYLDDAVIVLKKA